MKTCPNCGRFLNEEVQFCNSCGAPVMQVGVSQNQFLASSQQPIYNPSSSYQPSYGQIQYPADHHFRPVLQLTTSRGLFLYIVLSILTLGIYSTIVLDRIALETNIVASRYDGQITRNYSGEVLILGMLTLGIYPLVWWSKLCNRMGTEIRRRNMDYRFGAGAFWLWCILGILLCGIGPFVFYFKLFKANRMINMHYNQFG